MTAPIKTQLLQAIETAIDGISEIKEVVRNPSKPIDRDTTVFPVAFVFDDKEESSRRNRFKGGVFPLHIEVWMLEDGDSITDLADIMQAEIHMAINEATDVIRLTTKIEEVSVEKLFVSEDMGVLIMIYSITYFHAWGNPYALNP